MDRTTCSCALAAITFTLILTLRAAAGEDAYATSYLSYDPGAGAGDFINPLAAIGAPARFTGGDIFPAVVSPFNAPWLDDQIVSIGAGGHLVLTFDVPITDDPDHPFGIDLIVFGNTMFLDIAWPLGIVGGAFGDDGGLIELSDDGETWHAVPGVSADGLFPTMGYLDAGPYDLEPGMEETDFTRPVDPALSIDDFLNANTEDILSLYNGSGGGAGVDIASAGLQKVTYVRIVNPASAKTAVQIDAVAKVRVPEPRALGDLDADGIVGVADLLLLLVGWGQCPNGPCNADLDGDGFVGIPDLLILLANWG